MALRKIGGLWLNEGKQGKYMAGNVSEALPAGAKIMVFKNTYKKPGEKTPDYTINVATDDQPAPKEDHSQAPPESDSPF